jgi:hypothetical protein
MMDTRPLTHEDYADEAQSAERGTAWSQASALWFRAAEMTGDAESRNRYLDAAARCDREVEVDKLLAGIARRELRVPTLDERKSDSLDFHEVVSGRCAERCGRPTGLAAKPRSSFSKHPPNAHDANRRGVFSWLASLANTNDRPQHGANVAASGDPGPSALHAFVERRRQAKAFSTIPWQCSTAIIAPSRLMFSRPPC